MKRNIPRLNRFTILVKESTPNLADFAPPLKSFHHSDKLTYDPNSEKSPIAGVPRRRRKSSSWALARKAALAG